MRLSYLLPTGFIMPSVVWDFAHAHGLASTLSVEEGGIRVSWEGPAPVIEKLRVMVEEIL